MTEERWTEQTAEHLTGIAETVILDRGSYTPEDADGDYSWCTEDSIEGIATTVVRAVLAALADAGLLVSPDWHPDPEGSAQLTTYSDGWQYAVATPRGDEPLVYGDQYWVSSGKALADSHPNGRIVRRKVAAYAGPWREVKP